MRVALLLAFVLSAACAGCGTIHRAPKFNEASDEFKIKTAVFRFLLHQHAGGDRDYGAIFPRGNDEEVAALIRAFPDHIPPLKFSDRVLFQPNRIPVDKDTGRPALVLGAEVSGPISDTAQAIGSWYAGPSSTGKRTFTLTNTAGEWMIASPK